MGIYVDDAREYREVKDRGRVYRGRFSHLVADTAAELADVLTRIGQARRGWG